MSDNAAAPLVLDKACDITPFSDTESTRYALGGVCWDAENNTLIATDSRMLAVVQPPSVNGEFDGSPPAPSGLTVIPSPVLRAAIRETRRVNPKAKRTPPVRHTMAVVSCENGSVEICTESASGKVSRKTLPIQGRFPKWKDVLPKREDVVSQQTFDPKLLKTICEYFVSHGGGEDRGITLTITDGAMEVSGKVANGERQAFVVVMPLSRFDEAQKCIPIASEVF